MTGSIEGGARAEEETGDNEEEENEEDENADEEKVDSRGWKRLFCFALR